MPARMNTDSRRRASATYHAKREADGLKKVTLWLGSEARDKLEAMKGEAGSKDKAADLAIMAYGAKPKTQPTKPAPAIDPTTSVGVPFAGDITRKPMQKKGK